MTTSDDGEDRIRKLMREGQSELPKRFYKEAGIADVDGGSAIRVDGRAVRTPGKVELVVPTAALAVAIAEEWNAQGERIDPASMPLTRLANTVLDGVVPQAEGVRSEIVRYAGSDLTCYRAEVPDGLVTLEAAAWDPLLAWAREAFGASLIVVEGIMPVPQPPEAIEAIACEVDSYEPFALGALNVLVTLAGSAVLALAVARGRLSAEEAWDAAHVDEDWQIAQWGEDAEAAERRALRKREFLSAARFLDLAGRS